MKVTIENSLKNKSKESCIMFSMIINTLADSSCEIIALENMHNLEKFENFKTNFVWGKGRNHIWVSELNQMHRLLIVEF